MDLEQRNVLIEKITQAFADTPYPQNGYIGREMQDDFGGKNWQDVANDVALLLAWRDELHEFSDEGLRYFMPAFLIAIIQMPDKIDTLISRIIGVFVPPDVDVAAEANLRYLAKKGGVPEEKVESTIANMRRNAQDQFQLKVNSFSQAQRVVIYEFLRAYKEIIPDYAWSSVDADALELAILFWEDLVENNS